MCQQEPVYLAYNDNIAIILETLSLLGFVMALFMGIFLILNRDHPIVKGTSLTFCLLILSGVLLGLMSVWVLAGRPTEAKCTLFVFIEVSMTCSEGLPGLASLLLVTVLTYHAQYCVYEVLTPAHIGSLVFHGCAKHCRVVP